MKKNNHFQCCSFCNGKHLSEVIDFGKVALAGGFLTSKQFDKEVFYPLRLYFCSDCYAVQVIDKVSEDTLFKNYFYFSSSIKTLCDHFTNYAAEIVSRFLDQPEKASVIEFGCNDGVLLIPLANQGIKTVIGVDPATNIVKTINDPRVKVINDFFNEKVAQKIILDFGKVDIVLANNVYAHIPDIQGITRAVFNVLNDEGVFIFEVHYLGGIINKLQYDMIYHEHLYYYSLLSLINHFNRYDMHIFDVKAVPTHAGSMRFYVCKKGSKNSYSESKEVTLLKKEELKKGFHKAETYYRFASDVLSRKNDLMDLLIKIKEKGQTIVGYGASGRANTMIQYCGIDHKLLDYIIDDAPAKKGFYTPGSHFLINSKQALRELPQPDYILIFAWSFFSEIAKKNQEYFEGGGKMIVPLPEIKIISNTKE